MSRTHRFLLGLQLVLGLGVVVFGVRVAAHYREARAELGRVKLSALAPETEAKLEGLQGECLITYYVSGRASMPSHLRRLEQSVTDVLQAFADASNGLLRYQIVDPEAQPELVRYTANQRVAPFRVRSVQRDSYSEETIWSTLTINYANYPQAVIHGVVADHVPRLQLLLREHLEQMEAPRRPRVALGSSAQDDFDELAASLERGTDVVRFDPATEPIPAGVDLFFWLAPGPVDAGSVAGLTQFLERGGSALVAGSEVRASLAGTPADGQLRVESTGYDAEPLLAAFGLRPTRALVLDRRARTFPLGDRTVPILYEPTCIAPNQDFHTLVGQPNGHLLFETPTPIELDGDLAAELGWRPEVLGTTSRFTWVQELPLEAPVETSALIEANGLRVAKQPLITLLRPVDPWKGSIAFFAADTCFRDGTYASEGFAHRVLTGILVDSLASNERLVLRRADAQRAASLPELGAGSRLFWRLFCILALPLLLGLILLRRRRAVPIAAAAPPGPAERASARLTLRFAVQLAAGLATVFFVGRLGLRTDWSSDGLNQLSPLTRAVTESSQPTEIQLWVSDRDRLPPDMRSGWRSLTDLARRIAREGDLRVSVRDPLDLDDAARAELESQGVVPLRVRSDDEERTTVRTIHSSVRLRQGDQSRVLAFSSKAAFETAELRLAFALWQLENGRTPHVALVSDLPRLSPAEAHEDYQLKGRFAPSGTDVYSGARQLLRDLGFRVTHVRQDEPDLPDDVDLLIWMQPRRDVGTMLEVMTDYLHGGGSVLVAAQYFNIQPRQYRGRDFETVYWPQPQTPDTERFFYADIGLELVWGVLFDDLKTRLAIETHVNRDASRRDYENQESALPFLIRASASNFAPDAPMMRGLGDQAFIWGNELRLDAERLAERELDAQVLMTTSDKSWRFRWSGGFLPPDVLEGPIDLERTDDIYRGAPKLLPATEATPAERRIEGEYAGKVPLAVRVSGAFPAWVDVRKIRQAATDRGETLAEEPEEYLRTGGAPGELVVIGCSEMFKNDRLLDSEFRADHLLINAACELTVGPELTYVASRRRIAPGFDYIEPERKLVWRVAVLAAGPLLLLAFGLLRVGLRRSPRVIAPSTPATPEEPRS